MSTRRSSLGSLFRPRGTPREALRPLWHRIVATSREPRWYVAGGVADNVPGRFDMIVAMLTLVLLRLERADAAPEHGVHLTELFVEDMDRQLRETGVGDLVVGKHIGRLVAVLGGRLGAYRDALAPGAPPTALAEAAARNTTLAPGRDATALAGLLRDYDVSLERVAVPAILASELPA